MPTMSTYLLPSSGSDTKVSPSSLGTHSKATALHKFSHVGALINRLVLEFCGGYDHQAGRGVTRARLSITSMALQCCALRIWLGV